MKTITLKLQQEKISLFEVEQFEVDNGFILPISFKQFLVQNNGGVPKERIFWDGVLESGVSYFYPLIYGENTIEKIINSIHRDDALPNSFLPFASTGGAGDYTISMNKDSFGAIYIFHYDGSEPFKIANSFEMFINQLEED